jgi:nicotinate phosphoribosyltransferase
MTISHRVGPLFTDHYELTMAAAYFEHRVFEEATFSLFIRKYPPRRNFFIAAGLEDVLRELESYRFFDNDVDYLKKTGLFSNDFISYLKQFNFSGHVFAMPEGTVFFANEPVLEVTAPVIEAQVIETFLLNTIGFQTMIASKAARCIHAAQGRDLIDFSLRRTQGHDAGMKVARSTYIAGFAGTSNVMAGQVYEIPTSGTMAHSYIQTYKRELDAFTSYKETFPQNSVFLIDTYDTLEGAQIAVKVAKVMKKEGIPLVGVRLDSGDMAVLSQQVREILDDAGLFEVKIFASSGFDEFKIADVLANGAKIDAFGVGTKIGVSADAPYVDIVYKLVRFNNRDVRKLSPGKMTLAGEKQVFRVSDNQERYREDYIGLRDDEIGGAERLLEPVMRNGKIVCPHLPLQDIQNRFKRNFSALDTKYKSLHDTLTYPVKLTRRLAKLQEPC